MKIKDLPVGSTLANKKVKTPKGVVGYWRSQWNAGVWLHDGKTTQIYPQFVDELTDCGEWELTEEPVNCHLLTGLEKIDNTCENKS